MRNFMQNSTLYPTVYVLGNGQLGRMLRYAGAPLDIHVQPLEFNAPVFDLPKDAIITAEIERWEKTPLTELLGHHKNFVNQNVFGLLADRFTQKSLLDELSLSTSPWCLLKDKTQWSEVFKNVGEKVKNGEKRFYPVTHNLQQNGILRYSVTDISFPQQQSQQTQAESMLGTIMDKLEYVGVMAMECFVVGDKLLINELAPRVHNSGHWTQLGCAISQFELHLRALLDLPTPSLQPIAPSVMVNLIGTKHNPQWLNTPFSQLHWYGKEVRPGRKLGHINITHPDKTIIIQQLEKLRHELPEDYQSGLNWAIEKLK